MWSGSGSARTTDRGLESVSVAAARQACAKPVAGDLRPWTEVEGHLDAIASAPGARKAASGIAYQDGTLAAIRSLGELLEASGLGAMPLAGGQGAAMLCGIRPARHFEMEMHDPLLGRLIRHAYRVRSLPVVA